MRGKRRALAIISIALASLEAGAFAATPTKNRDVSAARRIRVEGVLAGDGNFVVDILRPGVPLADLRSGRSTQLLPELPKIVRGQPWFGADLSNDGRFLVFEQFNARDPLTFALHLFDRTTKKLEDLGTGTWISISADGSTVAVGRPLNTGRPIRPVHYLAATKDLLLGKRDWKLASVLPDGATAWSSGRSILSKDGQRLLFESTMGADDDRVRVFSRDVKTAKSSIVSEGRLLALASDGNVAATFANGAAELVDLRGARSLIRNRLGQPLGQTWKFALSADGRRALFLETDVMAADVLQQFTFGDKRATVIATPDPGHKFDGMAASSDFRRVQLCQSKPPHTEGSCWVDIRPQ